MNAGPSKTADADRPASSTSSGAESPAAALDAGKRDKSEGDAADAGNAASPVVAAFAAVLAHLSVEDRQRLAAMLTGQKDDGVQL